MIERVALGASVAALVFCTVACGGPPKSAQLALTTSAVGLVEADRVHAAALAAAAAIAQQRSESFEEWERAMRPWERSTRALELAADSLRAMQRALDAWKVGAEDGKSRWLAAVACALPVFEYVARQLRAHNMRVPETLDAAIRLMLPWASANCTELPQELESAR